jgi:hypothetical protein
MRTFFTEGDLLVAEVQQLFSDGAASLHTRSLKYGKLRNGLFVAVPPMLVVRSKSHMYPLGAGVHCILGTNGFVWVSKDVKSTSTGTGIITRLEEEASEAIYSNINEVCVFGPMLICRISMRRHDARLQEFVIVSSHWRMQWFRSVRILSDGLWKQAMRLPTLLSCCCRVCLQMPLILDVQERLAQEVLYGE